MIGAGGLFAVIMSNAYGRWPTIFWMLCFSVIFAVLAAAAPNFNTFMTARILQGFFSAPAQATGLMFVKDMHFFHEQVRRVNLWTSFFILSPYLGPIVSAAILSHDSGNVSTLTEIIYVTCSRSYRYKHRIMALGFWTARNSLGCGSPGNRRLCGRNVVQSSSACRFTATAGK